MKNNTKGYTLFIIFLILILNLPLLNIINSHLIFTSELRISDTERLSLDGVVFVLTELSGVYTDVDDDPDSPDSLWLLASGNNVDTDVRGSFSTPTGNPTIGADLQEFRALVRQYDEGQAGTPNSRIELWENGILIRAGSNTLISTGGIVLSFTWNANELSTSDGSLVECKVVGVKTGGAPSTRNTVEVGAIEWNVDYSVEGDTNPPTWDTLTESADPLNIGNTEIININVYDFSIISFVYIEINNVNYTMDFISGNNYRNSTWIPLSIGVKNYSIWMIDEYNNINWTGIYNITVQEYQDDIAPIWSNLIEINDPLELGKNITIRINVYDDTNISFVYIEINNVNYTMYNISNTYSYSKWLPLTIGVKEYQIWLIDYYNNTANIRESIIVLNTPYIILSLFILFSLIIIISLLFITLKKKENYLLFLIIFLFSLLIGVISLTEYIIPFTPYLQFFFLLFQSSIFIITSLEVYKK